MYLYAAQTQRQAVLYLLLHIRAVLVQAHKAVSFKALFFCVRYHGGAELVDMAYLLGVRRHSEYEKSCKPLRVPVRAHLFGRAVALGDERVEFLEVFYRLFCYRRGVVMRMHVKNFIHPHSRFPF